MIGGLLVSLAGAALVALGTAIAAGAASVSRLELSRWVAERHHAAPLATMMLSAPDRILGLATALVTGGTIVIGLGAAVGLVGLERPAIAGGIIVGLPALLGMVHTVPRAAGRRWAEPLMRTLGPTVARAARAWATLAPAAQGNPAPESPESPDGATQPAGDFSVVAGVIAFTERPVREVMTPRTEIVAAAEGAPLREMATLFQESGYTRLPVYRETLDDIIGMIHAFDVLKAPAGESPPLRPVTVAPSTRRCADLLVEMQRERHQFAVVLDEYGGTAGIVTLEDLLEELVGEIFDEYDRPPPVDEPAAELLEVDGTASCEEVATRFGVALAPRRAETVGGLLAGVLGRIPRLGERVVIDGLEFDVLGATPTRVERVVIRRAPSTPP